MKWLTIGQDSNGNTVYLTERCLDVAEKVDPFFEGLEAVITSGLRPPEHQLNAIRAAFKRKNIQDSTFTLFIDNKCDFRIRVDGEEYFWWQWGWSKLLSSGELINPPIAAEVLTDYIDPDTGVNKKGRVIPPSSHQSGRAFDIGGARHLLKVAERVARAWKSGSCGILSIRIEKSNNCVHIFC